MGEAKRIEPYSDDEWMRVFRMTDLEQVAWWEALDADERQRWEAEAFRRGKLIGEAVRRAMA